MSIEKEIQSVLRQLGVKISYTGYQYVVYGILLTLQNRVCLTHITKLLYVDIATKYKTSVLCVERNIRTVVQSIWNTDNQELLAEICDGIIHKRPTNTEFFNIMYDYFTKRYLNINGEILISEDIKNGSQTFSCMCSHSGSYCEQLNECYNIIFQMRAENQRLYKMIFWINNEANKLSNN